MNPNLEVIKNKLSHNFENFYNSCSELEKYIDFEVKHGDFFSDISSDSIFRFGQQIDKYLRLLNQFLISLNDDIRDNLLIGSSGKWFIQVVDTSYKLTTTVTQNCLDEKTKIFFATLSDVCIQLKNDYGYVLVPYTSINQPDQVTEKIEVPKEGGAKID